MTTEEKVELETALINVVRLLTRAKLLPWKRNTVERLSDFIPDNMPPNWDGTMPQYPCFTVDIKLTAGILEETDLAAIGFEIFHTPEEQKRIMATNPPKLEERGMKLDCLFYDAETFYQQESDDECEEQASRQEELVVNTSLEFLADIDRYISGGHR